MTDRLMTPRLEAALDALTGSQRRFLKVIAAESEHDWLRGLLEGLVGEVVAGEMHELTTLHDLEVDRLADVDKAAEGAVWPAQEDPGKGAPWWPQGKPEGLE
jgi:hypothetical protein